MSKRTIRDTSLWVRRGRKAVFEPFEAHNVGLLNLAGFQARLSDSGDAALTLRQGLIISL